MERRTRLILYAVALLAIPPIFVYLLSAGPLGWMLILFCLIGVVLYIVTEENTGRGTCTNCGATVNADADQCPYCGSVR